MKTLSKVLGLKDKMPGMVPMSSVFVLVRLMVQLIMSVVMLSTPVARAAAFLLASLCVLFRPEYVNNHGVDCVQPCSV